MPRSILANLDPQTKASEVIEIPSGEGDHITWILERFGNKNPTLGSYFEVVFIIFAFFFWVAPKTWKLISYFMDRHKDKQIHNWEAIANFNQELIEVLTRLDADQGYLVKSHNGGGVPNIGQKCYVTVTNSVGTRTRNGHDLWDSIPIDTCYSNLILKLLKEQVTLVDAKELPDSDLKVHYMKEGVQYSIMYLLKKGRKELLFLNYTYKKELPSDRVIAEQLAEMRIRGKKLASMIPVV